MARQESVGAALVLDVMVFVKLKLQPVCYMRVLFAGAWASCINSNCWLTQMFAEKFEALKEEECTVLIYTTFLLFPIHV